MPEHLVPRYEFTYRYTTASGDTGTNTCTVDTVSQTPATTAHELITEANPAFVEVVLISFKVL